MKLLDFKSLGPVKGIGYSRDHLRRKVKAGEFPAPVALSDRRIAWRESEVDAWLASRPRRDSSEQSQAPEHGSSRAERGGGRNTLSVSPKATE
jgi:prophage regulatory protein